jgi:hypothetical protein
MRSIMKIMRVPTTSMISTQVEAVVAERTTYQVRNIMKNTENMKVVMRIMAVVMRIMAVLTIQEVQVTIAEVAAIIAEMKVEAAAAEMKVAVTLAVEETAEVVIQEVAVATKPILLLAVIADKVESSTGTLR